MTFFSSHHPALHRRGVTVLLALAVAVPLAGVGALAEAQAASHAPSPMVYDRDFVTTLNRQLTDERRAALAAFYRGLEGSRLAADRTRASRGEPRAALSAGADRGLFWRPTTGVLSQDYHPGHPGIDLAVPIGTPVVAAGGGTVSFAGDEDGYGTHVEVTQPDGTTTTYSHLSAVDVTVGQHVESGQRIAESGNTGNSTGPHLHFEVHPTKDTTTDPLAWLKAHGAW